MEKKKQLKKELGERVFNQLYDDILDEFSYECGVRVTAFAQRHPNAVKAMRDIIDLEDS